MVFFISITFALLLTGFVLAPWYVDQILSFLSGKAVEIPTLILILATVTIISLLVSGLGERRPWMRWNVFVTLLVIAMWIASVIYAFTAVEPDSRRYGPGLIFAISSLWVPFFAWSLFLPLSWLGRFAILLSLLILQPLFIVRYKVKQTNDQGDMIVLKRSTPYMAAHNKGSQNSPPVKADTREIKKQTLSTSLHEWTLAKNGGTEGKLIPGLAPNSLLVEMNGDGGNEPWKLQLIRSQFAYSQGDEVSVSFRARSPKPRKIQVEVSQNHEPWKPLGINAVVDLKPEWQVFTFKNKLEVAEPDARLVFNVGGNNTSVEIADVEAFPLPRTSAPATPVPSAPIAAADQTTKPATPEGTKAPDVVAQPAVSARTSSAAKSAVLLEGWSLVVDTKVPVEMTPVMKGEAYWSIKVPSGDSKSTDSIKLENAGLTLQKDKRYEVRLRARASAPRDISVGVTQLSDPWSTMRLAQRFELNNEWQDLTGRFKASESGPCRIQVKLGGESATIDVSQIQLIALD